jgi:hypothetical protein
VATRPSDPRLQRTRTPRAPRSSGAPAQCRHPLRLGSGPLYHRSYQGHKGHGVERQLGRTTHQARQLRCRRRKLQEAQQQHCAPHQRAAAQVQPSVAMNKRCSSALASLSATQSRCSDAKATSGSEMWERTAQAAAESRRRPPREQGKALHP